MKEKAKTATMVPTFKPCVNQSFPFSFSILPATESIEGNTTSILIPSSSHPNVLKSFLIALGTVTADLKIQN